jgi:formimidoylglutamate deiminase
VDGAVTLPGQGPRLPGLPNLHSHAFQRAFAGLTEHGAPAGDNFWSWRTRMYRFAAGLTPERLRAIATWLYVEMLEAGYTQVCEFHYVHHRADGRPYADDAAMCHALIAAARDAGIGLTLLPVLYQSSGFGAQAPQRGQRRFVRSVASMLSLLELLVVEFSGLKADLAPESAAQAPVLGVAPHSLRAVPPAALADLLAGVDALLPGCPIHIHIAEQRQEVDDCLAHTGQRPVAWLLDHAPVDARWCLVHATHMDDAEARAAAASGAVAGLCPSTEANLGDGLFDLPRWRSHGGAWGLGSDSHVTVNAAEELLLLEYGQRLARRERNVGATAAEPDTARALYEQALAGGWRAAGLAGGRPGDAVVLDPDHPALAGLPDQAAWAAHVFASHRTSAIREVWVGGRRVVHEGRHPLHEQALAGFVAARRALLQESAS